MKFRASQLNLIKDLPNKIGIKKGIKREQLLYKESWRDTDWYLTPFYRTKYKHIRNYVNSSNGRTFKEVLYKIKKIAGNTASLNYITDMCFDFSDRNNEFNIGYDGWSTGHRRQCVEHRVYNGLIEVRTPLRPIWKLEKVKLTHQEHYKLRSDYRKARKNSWFRKKTIRSVSNLHKKWGLQVKGYTKQQRFDYMCKYNSLETLLKFNILKLHGPLRLGKILVPNPFYRFERNTNRYASQSIYVDGLFY